MDNATKTVTVEGHGMFSVPNDKIQELLNWLAKNQSVKVQSEQNKTNNQKFSGDELIYG